MHRNRGKKGISTIIAAVFMIAIIILGLGVLTAGLNMQNDLGQVVTERTGLEAEQIKERVEMRDVKIDSNKFNMTLVNTGMLPVKIVRAWVTNTSDTTNGWHTLYDNLNYLINPGASYVGFGQQSPLSSLVAKTDKSYEIKVVTERGTTTSFKILNGVDAKLNARLIASPPIQHPGEYVAITMLVTHNNTLADAVLDIKPPTTLSWAATPSSGSPTPNAVKISGPDPTQDPNILRGSVRAYTWTYELTSQNNTKFTFSGQLQGGKSNTPTVDVTSRLLKITSTDYSTNSGILTINYTSFHFTQLGGAWTKGWSIQGGERTAFKVNMTNNNLTGTFWISRFTTFTLDPLGSANDVPFYITNETIPGSGSPNINKPYTCPAPYANDFCKSVPPGGTLTLIFAGSTPNEGAGTMGVNQLSNTPNRYAGNILIFGKFAANKNDIGTQYGQNLPFMGIDAT
ncbi:MAG: hypothetical protein HMLIMOIP_001604 [Candidatus Nitrosomirales archaeon]|jgi:hypothetical protein